MKAKKINLSKKYRVSLPVRNSHTTINIIVDPNKYYNGELGLNIIVKHPHEMIE